MMMESTPKHSPWGHVDGSTILAPGIVSVSTASHGGIHLDRTHVATMRRLFPDCPRLNSPWFEEDCDWSVPFTIFADEIREYLTSRGPSWELDHLASNIHAARTAWRNWLPDAWEQYHNCTLEPDDSYVKRERIKAVAVTA